MDYITLIYTDNRKIIKTPATLEKLEQKVMELFNVFSEAYHYYDDEEDLITITSDSEYQEFLRAGSKLAIIIPASAVSLLTSALKPEEKSLNSSINELSYSVMQASGIIQSSFEIFQGENSEKVETSERKLSEDLMATIRVYVKEEIERSALRERKCSDSKHDIQCSNCGASPIIGVRYKCSECEINLCDGCEDKAYHLHPMFKINQTQPVQKEGTTVAVNLKNLKIDATGAEFARPTGKAMFHLVEEMKAAGFEDTKKNYEALAMRGYSVQKAIEIVLDI